MEMVIPLLMAAMVLPFFIGFIASEYGRSFWSWFALGCVGHLFTAIALVVLIRRDRAREAPPVGLVG